MLLRSVVAILGLAALATPCLGVVLDNEANPRQNLAELTKALESQTPQEKRADASLAGYLGVFFLGSDPYVYFYLSNGNDPLSLKALNRGSPIMKPTKGTGGVRDPAIVRGGGTEAGRKWYIVGTDLDIGKVRRARGCVRLASADRWQTNWGASQRTGSRGIFVWESTDLINWENERLAVVEDNTAGMVWAPEAIWDAEKSQLIGAASSPHPHAHWLTTRFRRRHVHGVLGLQVCQ